MTRPREIHGMKGTREYRAWRAMKDRCTREKCPNFKYYGARGIKVCDRWMHSFTAFYLDMGPCPKGMSIDRINNDGNYERGNCRWTTATIQNQNKRAVNHSSRFTGVCFDKRSRKWRSYRRQNGKQVFLGVFKTEQEAADALSSLTIKP